MTDITVKNMPLNVGHTLTVTGVPTVPTEDADHFMINIHSGEDIPFQMSVWLNPTSMFRDSVMYKTMQGGSWHDEINTRSYPFKYRRLFKVTVTLTREEFLVLLSDGSEVHVPNRLGASEYKDFSFKGGVLIRSFEIN